MNWAKNEHEHDENERFHVFVLADAVLSQTPENAWIGLDSM